MTSVRRRLDLAESPSLRPPVVIDGALTLADVDAIAQGAPVALDEAALGNVSANRAGLEQLLGSDQPLYGINTGFGALVSERLGHDDLAAAQLGLLRSHAAGVGAELPRPVVRGALGIRLNGLIRGRSGVRPQLLRHVASCLNADLVPRVPRTGSLGASGDLAPSAHAFLPLVGEGEFVDRDGVSLPAHVGLKRIGLAPLELAPKEGLALINGTHFMASIGATSAVRIERLFDAADAIGGLTVDALSGAPGAFDPRIHALRPVPGQAQSARNVRTMIAGSARIRSPGSGLVQDAYSLRCIPQVHGAAREAATFFARLVEVDINAVTDNPLVLQDEPRIVSAGNFHGQTLGLAFDTLRIALADMAAISERRTFRLLSPSINGELPPFLTQAPGVASGYMIVQYVAAALVAELRALAHPVSVDNVTTSDNQEDHVSMGMTAATMTLDALERFSKVLACELLCATQAMDCSPAIGGTGSMCLHEVVRELVPPLAEDRPPAGDIETLSSLVDGSALQHLLRDIGGSAET